VHFLYECATSRLQVRAMSVDNHKPAHLTFDSHLQNVLVRVLSHAGFEAHPTVASALVNSRLDCANSVLYKTSSVNMLKLQRVQNSLARVVIYTKRVEHIHPLLHQSHWLPINYRINYKVATLAYKVRSTGSTAYLLPSVSDYVPTRNLRSSSQYLLNVPVVRTQIARRAFSHAAPSVWNNLPVDIRRSESFGRFRTLILTLYFTLAFID